MFKQVTFTVFAVELINSYMDDYELFEKCKNKYRIFLKQICQKYNLQFSIDNYNDIFTISFKGTVNSKLLMILHKIIKSKFKLIQYTKFPFSYYDNSKLLHGSRQTLKYKKTRFMYSNIDQKIVNAGTKFFFENESKKPYDTIRIKLG